MIKNRKIDDKEIRAITGFRAIAALGVFCFHFGLPGASPQWISNFAANGGLGVPFFFVLSGFVLTLSYENRTLQPITFAVDRFARIGPTYYLAFALAFVNPSLSNSMELNYVFYIHLFALQSWFPTSDPGLSFNGPAWTISVEVFLYAMFPLLLKLATKKKSLYSKWYFAFLGGITLSLIPFAVHLYFLYPMNELNNSHSWTFLLPVHYLGLFVVGMSGCLARKDIERFFSKINLGPTICDVSIVLFGIAMMRINFMDSKHPILAKSAQFWLIGILAVWILTLVSINSKTSRFARILNTKLFWFAGRISMVFYLVHVPAVSWLVRFHPDSSFELKLSVTTIFSIIIHLFIEQPLNRFIRGYFASKTNRQSISS
jgi:peptidoglycan/LPS O-acetylase OafA/YrhL